MLTGKIRSQIEKLRKNLWEGGVANPLTNVKIELDFGTLGDPLVSAATVVTMAPRAADRSGERTSTESLDVRWWPVADLPELEPSMLTLIARTRDRLC